MNEITTQRSSPALVELPVELPTAPAAPVRTKNTLTLGQQLKLARWCHEHTEQCQTETYSKLASIAAATLEFTVTAANMSSTIDACEIERKKPDAPPTLEEQIATLRDRLDKAEGDSKALRGTVEEILAGMRAMSARVERLEMHHEDRIDRSDITDVVQHPELPNLPPPAFGAAAATAAQ